MINFNDIPKQAKHFAVIYSFDGNSIHDLTYRYYDENHLPINWGQVIELVESEDPECPFDINRFDNHTREDLKEIAEIQLEQIKQHPIYNIPENAIGCLKVYMKLESDGEIEETEGIHIVFFDEDWLPMNDDIYVLYNTLTNELFENPFENKNDYSFDCEEFEIRYGL